MISFLGGMWSVSYNFCCLSGAGVTGPAFCNTGSERVYSRQVRQTLYQGECNGKPGLRFESPARRAVY